MISCGAFTQQSAIGYGIYSPVPLDCVCPLPGHVFPIAVVMCFPSQFSAYLIRFRVTFVVSLSLA